ncbi:MAG: imidazolonepropionase [Gemmatimonadetes bacterium]|nr:imidazolonepropionase [Gemmatimonadota bacterium]
MTRSRWDCIWLGGTLATFDPSVPGPMGEVTDAALAIDEGRIVWLGRSADLPGAPEELATVVRPAHGLWITPGLIDCHTHVVHGGDRIGEWVARLEGRDYDDIAREGGGIMDTVRRTRAAGDAELQAGAVARLTDLARDGVTTVEVKSGYDLTTAGELRMLDIAHAAGRQAKVEVQGTLLGLHALPPEFSGRRDDYVDLVAREMVPAAAEGHRARQVDAFVEDFAFGAEECERVFRAARKAGLGLRVHADQRSACGGAALAGRWAAASADHLERTDREGVRALARGGSVAVLLPGAYLTLRDDQPPPIQAFRDEGVPLAVATDLNPGSSPLRSVRTAGSLACSLFGLHPAEALAGMTREAARVLDLPDRGRLAVGLRADLAVWEVDRPEELLYWIGGSPLRARVVGGDIDDGHSLPSSAGG